MKTFHNFEEYRKGSSDSGTPPSCVQKTTMNTGPVWAPGPFGLGSGLWLLYHVAVPTPATTAPSRAHPQGNPPDSLMMSREDGTGVGDGAGWIMTPDGTGLPGGPCGPTSPFSPRRPCGPGIGSILGTVQPSGTKSCPHFLNHGSGYSTATSKFSSGSMHRRQTM